MDNLCNELLYLELGKCLMEHFSMDEFDYQYLLHDRAIQILREIRDIMLHPEWDDFQIVEEIVCVFEKHHISIGNIHDY